MTFLLHYLDDFLSIGMPGSAECRRNLDIIIQVCKILGIPLTIEKVTGPTTTIDYLGIYILLDTSRLAARLPGA